MWRIKVGKMFQIGIARQVPKYFKEDNVDHEGSFFIAQEGFETNQERKAERLNKMEFGKDVDRFIGVEKKIQPNSVIELLVDLKTGLFTFQTAKGKLIAGLSFGKNTFRKGNFYLTVRTTELNDTIELIRPEFNYKQILIDMQ